MNTISAPPEKLVRELLEMNMDLLTALAPELAGSPNLRRALAYHRAAWGNVSSFRADVFVSLIAYTLAECSPDQMQSHIDTVMKFSEAISTTARRSSGLGWRKCIHGSKASSDRQRQSYPHCEKVGASRRGCGSVENLELNRRGRSGYPRHE